MHLGKINRVEENEVKTWGIILYLNYGSNEVSILGYGVVFILRCP